ncbi:MAG: hypothetical protein ABI120_16460 [Gemmatimonadaceae bacterium]
MLTPCRAICSTLALATIAVACNGDTPPPPNVFPDLPRFTLGASPIRTLADDGSANRQFTRISARRLPNGEIAVADMGSTRLMIFGRDGQMTKEVAHKGTGPGELPGEFNITSFGDTIIAFERGPMSAGTANVFVVTGGLLRRVAPKAINYSGRMSIVARSSQSRWIVQRGLLGRVIESVPPVGGFMPDSQTLGVMTLGSNPDSSTVEWLPPLIRYWSVVVPIPGATGLNGSPTALPATFLFKGETLNTTSDGQLWIVNSVSGELVAHDLTGKEVVNTTVQLPARNIDVKEVAILRDSAVASAKNGVAKAMAAGRYDEKSLPKTLPFFSEMIAGANGEVWLKVFELSSAKAQQYVVIARDGKSIATVVVPGGLRVQHVGTDFVLALSADGMGVESVVEYALKR